MTLPHTTGQHNDFVADIHANLSCLKASDARLALEDALRGLEQDAGLRTEDQRQRLQIELEAITALVDVLWQEYVDPEGDQETADLTEAGQAARRPTPDATALADACWEALPALAWAAQYTPETEAIRQAYRALERALATEALGTHIHATQLALTALRARNGRAS